MTLDELYKRQKEKNIGWVYNIYLETSKEEDWTHVGVYVETFETVFIYPDNEKVFDKVQKIMFLRNKPLEENLLNQRCIVELDDEYTLKDFLKDTRLKIRKDRQK